MDVHRCSVALDTSGGDGCEIAEAIHSCHLRWRAGSLSRNVHRRESRRRDGSVRRARGVGRRGAAIRCRVTGTIFLMSRARIPPANE